MESKVCGMCNSAVGVANAKMLFCSRCRAQVYCSKKCQVSHWPQHKLTCSKPLPSSTDVPITAGALNQISNHLQAVSSPASKATEEAVTAAKKFNKSGDKKQEMDAWQAAGKQTISMGEFHSSIEYFENCLNIAISRKDLEVQEFCYAHIGICFRQLGQVKNAAKMFKKIIKMNKPSSSCKGYLALAEMYHMFGDFAQEIDNLEICFKLANKSNLLEAERAALTQLAAAYQMTGHHEKAVDKFKVHLQTLEKAKDEDAIAMVQVSLGVAYDQIGNAEKAMEMFNKSLENSTAVGNKKQKATAYIHIAMHHEVHNHLESSIESYQNAIKIASELEMKDMLGHAYGGLGVVHSKKGEHDKAIELYLKHLELETNKQTSISTCCNLARGYGDIGEWEKSLEFHIKAMNLGNECNLNEFQLKDVYANIANAHQKLGNETEAARYTARSKAAAHSAGK
eukprot:CAMPEP_0175148876 /NCGR_PEP_ID=MMETSP0087-20121206/16888_1 /TAXON_ID=136419 /ORGANISM="Unknown Unknown, Strain D1" /LENGTH=452 /DNA_ID=CAMNT_0016434419 /DNA_START=27 /DNA_END=1385 /DNA_ORIENTATION=-